MRYLPPGFVELHRTAFRYRGTECVMVRYTDGLNSIYFLQERTEAHTPQREGPRPGRRQDRNPGDEPGNRTPRYPITRSDDESAVSSRYTWKYGLLRLTLRGGVDRQQMEKMAASVGPEAASPTRSAQKR
jgi:hypothetical protein